jgi:class 3 adenylate cyclase/CHASE2 domain-containing sensor protein
MRLGGARLLTAAGISLGCVLATEAVWRAGGVLGLDRLEEVTVAQRQTVTPVDHSSDGPAPSPVAIVFFDAESVSEWPWESPFPRSRLADLVRSVSEAGARVIGLDVYLERRYPELNALDGGDDRLAQAIQDAGNVVLVAPTVPGDDGPRLARPHPDFALGAAAVASADLPNAFEEFGDAALVTRDGDALAPGLALALWSVYRGMDLDSLLDATLEEGRVALPGLPAELGRIPESWVDGTAPPDDATLPVPIRFVGPPSHVFMDGRGQARTFDAFAAADVPVLAAFAPEYFRDRIVLLGSGFHDPEKFRTPYSAFVEPGADEDAYQWTFGVEIHANLLQNILDGSWVDPVGMGGRILLLVLASLATVLAVFRFGATPGAAAALAVGGAVWVAGFALWSRGASDQADYALLPIVPGLLVTALAYTAATAWTALVEGREKRFIKGAFGKYLSPDLVDRIASDPAALGLGGTRRTLSILFSDLSGFTDLSERLDPQELVAQLNQYLEDMTGVVLGTGGYLDKYIGDAIMAFWNAPSPSEDHADRALRCAVLMQRAMTALNRRWLEEDPDTEPLVVRIGVNTGEAVVGNVGGEARFDYSAIGDPVNLAARLEPANKTYDTLIMCSEDTLRAATPGAVRTRELDLVAVKGKTRPVRVFEVLEMGDHTFSPARDACLAAYADGLAAYRSRDFPAAEAAFARALEHDGTDGPSQLYLERTRELRENPPPADWDFVVRRTTK